MADDQRVREILDQVSELPVDQRAVFLERACGNDAELRREVESLLKSLAGADEFLADPPSEQTSDVASPDDLIGPYKLVKKLGEGGMGAVYLAEQITPVRRSVALKIIKFGMDSSSVIARFENERQALALMDHSNIARVYDAGTTATGRPYFVMELVQGQTITKYCDENRLTASERLELFIPICQAVQHAHQKGIIHRDLKPANVLVTTEDGRRVVKVIDFGIAKAIDQQTLERTAFTRMDMLMGTPEYMSPEQASGNPREIDTRSDVYALGVILYELLTGATPLDRVQLLDAGYEQMMRTIREVMPPRPSTRLSTLGESVASVAALRRTEPQRLTKILTGDLDLIVMKCLEKERSERYDTASSLARDIERYINDDPIEASPPSNLYVLKKLAWKHRRLLAVAAVIVGCLIATSLTFWVLKGEAIRQRDIAVRALSDADTARRAETIAKNVAELGRSTAETEAYYAGLVAASSNITAGNLASADDYLNRTSPRLRNWEWNYLHAVCNQQVLTVGFPYGLDQMRYFNHSQQVLVIGGDSSIHLLNAHDGHEEQVIRLAAGIRPFAVSDDLTRIIGEKRDLSLLVLDGSGRELVPVQLPLPAYVYTTRFTRDNSRFVTSSRDNVVRLFDTATGKIIREFVGDHAEVISTQFNPDETQLVTGAMDGIAKVWDVQTGKCLTTYQDPSHGWIFCSFSPDGKRIVSSSFARDRQGSVWNAATGDELLPLTEGIHNNVNLSAQYSPDGKMVAFSGGMFESVLDANTGHLITTLAGHHQRVPGVEFSQDGVHLLTGCNDNTARVWSLNTPANPLVLGNKTRPAADAEFTSDSQSVVIHFADQSVQLVNIATGKAFSTLDAESLKQMPKDTPPAANSSPDRVATNADGTEIVSDARTGKFICRLETAASGSNAVTIAFSNDGQRAITGTATGTLQIWNSSNGQLLKTLSPSGSSIQRISVSPKDDTIVVARADGSQTIWNLTAGMEIAPLDKPGVISSYAFSHDGKSIVAVSFDRFINILDSATGRRINRLYRGHADVRSAAFDPTDSKLVLTFQDDIGEVWTLGSKQQVALLRGHDGCVLDACYNHAGTRIVTTSQDHTARIWDADSGRELLTLHGHMGSVTGAAISNDDSKILTISDDGTVCVWNSASPEFLATLLGFW
jgi:WD40 repeat protein/serine/threonine protein kinase